MYSDNEDYGFDDFEKNIFNEISRRAILRSKNLSKSQSELNKRQQEERSSPMRSTMRNSSTQTLDRDNQEESLERIRRSSPSLLASNIDNDSIQRDSDRDKQTNPMTMISGSEADIFEPKLHSISKIWIDRPKEQREIYMKTDICKDGQVKRMTEIRNKKPNEEMIRIENECFPPDHHREWVDQNSIDNRETGAQPMKILKTEGHKETNRHREKELLSRTQSAFDLFEEDIINANQNEYLFGKAFSSLDISDSKSPISEGYYSEHLDSLNRNLSPTTNNQSYPLITRQFSVQKNKDNDKIQPKIFSKAYNNEGKENLWTLNNEMIIENVGNEMNITTRSISRRNQSKSLQAVNNRNETIQDREIDENNGLIDPRNVSDFVPQQHYNHHNETDRNYPKMNQNTLMATSNHNDFSNGCKFSFICNYDRGASLVLQYVFKFNFD
ncbi:hypothetical protein QR98_0069650 [Sarcoptes scabiei]|uniref:Uncharacterized protein n=1 Tax=Sarcoptes scabiei TaxID=52283 RepID=A0A132ABS2_SARSC|nr:hypothetical protein QR98_0069650 [Sarcoptes scabiei]